MSYRLESFARRSKRFCGLEAFRRRVITIVMLVGWVARTALGTGRPDDALGVLLSCRLDLQDVRCTSMSNE